MKSTADRPRSLGAIAFHPRGWLPVIGVSGLVGTACTLALPAVLGHAVDRVVAGDDGGNWLWFAVVLIVMGAASDLIDSYASAASLTTTAAWLRGTLVRHVLDLGVGQPQRFDNGDLVTRVSANCVDAARAGPGFVAAFAAVVPAAGSLVLLAVLDVWLVAAFAAGTAVVAVVLRLFTSRTAAVSADYNRVQGRIAGRLAEAIAGARTIAAAGTVPQETRRVLSDLPELHAHGARIWRVLAAASAQGAVAGPLVLIGVLAAGGIALWNGRISPGELFAASQYAAIGAGLGGLTGVFAAVARSMTGGRRLLEVLDIEPVVHGDQRLPDGPGKLEFRDVSLSRRTEVIVDDVSLTVTAGSTVAVVGDAGKSVLAELAARLRDPDTGAVLLDGVPLRALSRECLRNAVGFAPARPVLVGATIAEALGPGRSMGEVLAASRSTRCHEFLRRLPHGYATPLAEAPLSGGERQRLGLARAWLCGRLLVLDDATSSLDTATELSISRTLAGESDRRTRLITTHRVATAARADLVVWLAGGRIRGHDTHEA
ncbi:MAG: ABC transporter ATP-binding protein, partial [Stackebrandtia sp.]